MKVIFFLLLVIIITMHSSVAMNTVCALYTIYNILYKQIEVSGLLYSGPMLACLRLQYTCSYRGILES